MPLSDGYLAFTATEGVGTLTPTSDYFGGPTGSMVFDDGDGNADTATDTYAGIPYSGYTININGNEYAIFSDGGGYYYIPYFDAVEDLSYLNVPLSPVNAANITQTGENAVVVNLCFLGGTMITTPTGERLVEDLVIGDRVRTADGRDVAVKWIGRQHVAATAVNLILPARLMPVRIGAGVLGNHSDLYVTADHAMLVDGVLCHAGALVNGTSITRVPLFEMGATYTVYHIETETHEILLANGAPAETFIDNVSRRAFDNFAEFEALYGDVPEMVELDYPRAMSARQVPERIAQLLGATKAA